jgi:hypothetical protein
MRRGRWNTTVNRGIGSALFDAMGEPPNAPRHAQNAAPVGR